MPDDKNPIITGGKEPLIKLPLFIMRRSKQLALLACLAVLVVAGLSLGGGFSWLERQSPFTKKTPTVKVNGQDVPAAFMTEQFKVKEVPQEPIDYQKQAQELEAKIAKGPADYKDYLNLGHIYLQMGNKTKAIESYEKSKQIADPKMPNYESYIKVIDDAIKQIGTSS